MARQLPRRRSSRDEEPEEEYEEEEERRPRRSRREDKEEKPRRSRRSRDEGEEERPHRGGKREHGKSAGRGWDTVKTARAETFQSAGMLAVKDKAVVLKFLESEPFAVYKQHWLGNPKRPYTCLDEKCPMCDDGYDTRFVALFNVFDLQAGENKYWQCGPDAAKKVMAKAESDKWYSPIDGDDVYFEVSREKQSNGFYAFNLDPVKGRDLEDEYDVEPLDEEELEEALDNLFDEDVIPYQSRSDLRAAAEEAEE